MSVRHPAVARLFYPKDPVPLLADVRSYLSPEETKLDALGCVVPHAGYIYSGRIAGAVFAKVTMPRHCFMLCPTHTGLARPLSVMSEGAWEIPLGSVRMASDAGDALKDST